MNLLILIMSMLAGCVDSPARVASLGRARLIKAYDRLSQAQRVHGTQAYTMRCTTQASVNQPGHKVPLVTTAHLTLVCQQQRAYFTDGDNVVYQDGKCTVSISPAQKTIWLTGAQATPAATLLPGLQLRRAVIDQATVKDLGLVNSGASPQRHLVLVPSKEQQQALHLTQIDYWLDEQTNALHSVLLHYPAGYRVHTSRLTFDQQSWQAQDPAVARPALAYVVDTHQHLLPAYQGYRLLDYRSN